MVPRTPVSFQLCPKKRVLGRACVCCSRRLGRVHADFILGRLTVRVMEGKGLRGAGNSMIFRPYVRVSLVEQRADAHGNIIGGGDAVATSEFASVGGRNPKWNQGHPSNTMTFPFQVWAGARCCPPLV
jgi:hypothetical protein